MSTDSDRPSFASRRGFLITFAKLGIAVLALPTTLVFRSPRFLGTASRRPGLRPVPDFADSVRAIGERYLATLDHRVDRANLRKVIRRRMDPALLTARSEDIDGRAFRKRLSRASRQDFENGDVVRLDGWILSRSEVDLGALLVLEG